MIAKPATNAAVAVSTGRVRTAVPPSAVTTAPDVAPEMNERYPGTSASAQGLANETNPAANASA